VAKTGFPDALRMRALKYGDSSDAEKDAVAERLRADGRHSEAILLFQGRPEHPFLAAEQAWAVAEGDAFHLQSLARMGRPVPAEDFRACAQAAEAKGRWMDARAAWLAAGDEAAVRRIAAHLPPSLVPPPPPTDAAS
jgi:hypothetical protein